MSETELQQYYSACRGLVSRIQSGDCGAIGELYDSFYDRTASYVRRRLGAQDVTDLTHDVFLAVVEAIRSNELHDATRLMGFIRTVLQRRIAAHLRTTIRRRNSEQDLTEQVSAIDGSSRPDHLVESWERMEMMRKVLGALSSREREILDRFYLQEQSAEQIRSEMRLTCTNYRVLKSRAKAKFGKAGRHRLKSASNLRLKACA
jgi:RNA polymerase sigma factor (sigma-70 family)